MENATEAVDRPPRARGRLRGKFWGVVKTAVLLTAAGVPMALAIDRRFERPRVGHRPTTLTVAVLDAETGAPVPGARVRVYWPALWAPDRVEEAAGDTGRDGRTTLRLNCRTVTHEGLLHSRGVLVYPQAYIAARADGFAPSEPAWLSEKTGRARDLGGPEPPPVRLVLRRKRPGQPDAHQVAGKGTNPADDPAWPRGARPLGGVRPGPWRIPARVFAEDSRETPSHPPKSSNTIKEDK